MPKLSTSLMSKAKELFRSTDFFVIYYIKVAPTTNKCGFNSHNNDNQNIKTFMTNKCTDG